MRLMVDIYDMTSKKILMHITNTLWFVEFIFVTMSDANSTEHKEIIRVNRHKTKNSYYIFACSVTTVLLLMMYQLQGEFGNS